MKNITLSADKEAIEKARAYLGKCGTTINAEFHKWLASEIEYEQKQHGDESEKIMKSIGRSKIGKMPTKGEISER